MLSAESPSESSSSNSSSSSSSYINLESELAVGLHSSGKKCGNDVDDDDADDDVGVDGECC